MTLDFCKFKRTGLLAPFLEVARGIPDNWPGECILRFDQRNDGSIYLSYHGINDASHGITINQWRALLDANITDKIRQEIVDEGGKE